MDTGDGIYMSGSGEFRMGKAGSSDNISYSGSTLSINSDTLDIDVSNLEISASGIELSTEHATMSLGTGRDIVLDGKDDVSVAIGGGPFNSAMTMDIDNMDIDIDMII